MKKEEVLDGRVFFYCPHTSPFHHSPPFHNQHISVSLKLRYIQMKSVSFFPDLDLISQEKIIKSASQSQIDFLKLCSETWTCTHHVARPWNRPLLKKKKEKNQSHELEFLFCALCHVRSRFRIWPTTCFGSYCTVAPPCLRCRKNKSDCRFSFLAGLKGTESPVNLTFNLYAFPHTALGAEGDFFLKKEKE